MIIAAYGMMNIKKLKLPIVISGYALLMAILFAISEDNWADLDKNMIYICHPPISIQNMQLFHNLLK